jgi:hypothetical protein
MRRPLVQAYRRAKDISLEGRTAAMRDASEQLQKTASHSRENSEEQGKSLNIKIFFAISLRGYV